MTARLSPTEAAEEFIDRMMAQFQAPSCVRDDLIFTCVMCEYITSRRPLRLSRSGHAVLRKLRSGQLTASPAQIARARENYLEIARQRNLTREQRAAEGEAILAKMRGRDCSPQGQGIGGTLGGNNPAPTSRRRGGHSRPWSGFQLINGRVVP